MTERYVAFLRAINVGGHTVTMANLRELFEEMGFQNVSTHIASGNVLFSAKPSDRRELESRIEQSLHTSLGYEVATFIRRSDEVDAIAVYQPFNVTLMNDATALNVGFCRARLTTAERTIVMAFASDIDDFYVHGSEVWWLCRRKQSESDFSNAKLEKALGCPSTFRTHKTVMGIAKKLDHDRY